MTNVSQDHHVIDLDNYSAIANQVSIQESWINTLNLTEDHRRILNTNRWLDDKLVNASLRILAKQFKDKFEGTGLQDVGIGICGNFNIETGEFIQVLHSNSNHWIVISTIGTNNSEVMIYDSLYITVLQDVRCQISSLICTPNRSIRLKIVDVVKQSGMNDCGLFAVAYVTTLSFGIDPGKLVFNQANMRKHLESCLENEHFTLFPVNRERRKIHIKAEINVPISCSCRMPEIRPMIECYTCREWYHVGACVSITCDKMKDRSFSWKCDRCSASGFHPGVCNAPGGAYISKNFFLGARKSRHTSIDLIQNG